MEFKCCAQREKNVLVVYSPQEKEKETSEQLTLHTGVVLTIGQKAATVEETTTRRQYYAPFHTWASVLHVGNTVIFQVDPRDFFGGAHRGRQNVSEAARVSHFAFG